MWELGVAVLRAKSQTQVVEGNPSTPGEQDPGQVSEPAAEPQTEWRGKMRHRPGRGSE